MGTTVRKLFAVSGILVAGIVEVTQYQQPSSPLAPGVTQVVLASEPTEPSEPPAGPQLASNECVGGPHAPEPCD